MFHISLLFSFSLYIFTYRILLFIWSLFRSYFYNISIFLVFQVVIYWFLSYVFPFHLLFLLRYFISLCYFKAFLWTANFFFYYYLFIINIFVPFFIHSFFHLQPFSTPSPSRHYILFTCFFNLSWFLFLPCLIYHYPTFIHFLIIPSYNFNFFVSSYISSYQFFIRDLPISLFLFCHGFLFLIRFIQNTESHF